MRRLLCILLTLLLLAGLVGCMATPATQESFVELSILPQETQSTTVAASTEAAPIPEETEVARSETAAPETARPTTASETEPVFSSEAAQPALSVTEDGVYDSKEEVALYIHSFGHLPSNYITKKEAEKLGWPGGELEPYAPGKCIGGSRFGNYEGLLPDAEGRSWTECDIDTLGAKSRGAKRIVFSNDGLIYYTGDHYEHFELLYGEEG